MRNAGNQEVGFLVFWSEFRRLGLLIRAGINIKSILDKIIVCAIIKLMLKVSGPSKEYLLQRKDID